MAHADPHQQPHDPHAGAPGLEPAPNDPTHDVNGRAIVLWVLAWTGVLFLGLYALLVLFDFVLAHNRSARLDEAAKAQAPTQLQQQLDVEHAFLHGGPQRKSIEQTMRELAKD